MEVTDNQHRRESAVIEKCKGPIVLNRVDTIKKHDWDSWSIVFNRFQSIFSRRDVKYS